MVPLSRLLDASRLNVCIAITNESRRTVIQLTCHLLLSCLLYLLEFPTLLAMREIIASAFLLVRISPRTDYKGTKKKIKDKRKRRKSFGFRLCCIITIVCYLTIMLLHQHIVVLFGISYPSFCPTPHCRYQWRSG